MDHLSFHGKEKVWIAHHLDPKHPLDHKAGQSVCVHNLDTAGNDVGCMLRSGHMNNTVVLLRNIFCALVQRCQGG